MGEFWAGFAEVDYTPAPGLALRGQQYTRIAGLARDPLMANAMALRSGEETVVMVSVDICFIPLEIVAEAQRRFAERTGLSGERLLIHATHSHVAPCTISYYWGDADPAFIEKLTQDIVTAAENAVSHQEPVSMFSGAGQLDYLGWNRRVMFADGSSVMHGNTSRPDFIGIEGPRDPVLSVLFARDAQGKIRGVVVSFSTHPNCVEDKCYYSADLPGEVRRLLKMMLGNDVVVVYLTSASGNTTPVIREPHTPVQPWMDEEGLLRSGLLMAGEAAKVIAAAIDPIADPELRVAKRVLRIPIRPFPKKGERCYPDFWSDESRKYYEGMEADWPRKMQEKSPVEVRVNAIRIGDTVICANPCELFVEFGLMIKEASPARVTVLSQLTDGYVGYVPTPLSFSRGGYETWPCGTSQLVPEAGGEIVAATREMLGEVF